MANPNKAAGYKRKMTLIAEETRPTREFAEEVKADWVREYKNTLRDVVVKITAFRVGPRPFSRPGVTRQAYEYAIRAYEKRVTA